MSCFMVRNIYWTPNTVIMMVLVIMMMMATVMVMMMATVMMVVMKIRTMMTTAVTIPDNLLW